MTRVVGAQVKAYLKPETTYGTAATGNYTQYGFMRAQMGASNALLNVDILGISANRDPGAPFLGEVDTSASVEVPINLEGFGHWLRLFFGAPASSGSTNFTHNFDSGALTLPSITGVLDYGSLITNRYSVNTGLRGSTLEIDFSPTGAATARIGLIGQGELRQSSSPIGTPVLAAGVNFNKFQGSISRAGSALAQVTAATLTYSNGLEAVRTIRSDRKIEGADPGITSLSGRITMRYAATTDALIADAISSTPAELSMALTIDANRSITFTAGDVYLSAASTPVEGPQGVQVQFDWRAAYDATDTRMLRAILKNQTASYA
jgi:hypothetical protein